MPDNTNSPLIRFAGFSCEWNHYKLGDIGKSYSGLSGKTKEDFGHGDGHYVTYLNVFSNPITSHLEVDAIEIDKRQYEVKAGDVFFTTSSETPEEVGMTSVCSFDTPNTYLNSFCFGYRLNEACIDLHFLAYNLRSDSFRKKITALAQGISRYNISKTKVMELSLSLPQSDEQKKIGVYFALVDNLITLHQRKYEKLVNLKKAMLDKMFPKNGELVPEVRFSGFSGNWERRKLGELVEFKRGLTYAPSDVVTYGIRVLRSSNIDGDTFVLSDADVFVRPSAVNIPFVKKGDILITAANGSSNLVGKHAVIDYTTGEMVHGGFMILAHPHKHSSYVNALISTPWYAEFIQTYIAGGNGAIGNLKMSDLSAQTVCVCSDKEQEKIGDYFANLNGYITLQHQKLEWLQKLKSAFLEKMFV